MAVEVEPLKSNQHHSYIDNFPSKSGLVMGSQ